MDPIYTDTVLVTDKKYSYKIYTNQSLTRFKRVLQLFDCFFSYPKGTVEVVANWKAVTPADVDLHAEIMRDPSQYSTANALEETSVACVTWPGVMAGMFRNNN